MHVADLVIVIARLRFTCDARRVNNRFVLYCIVLYADAEYHKMAYTDEDVNMLQPAQKIFL